MIRPLALGLIVAASYCAAVHGAEFFFMDHDPLTDHYVGPAGPLVISGEIERGDYARLLRRITDDETRFLSQNKIILASTAGDTAEALKIAGLVKSLHSEVNVSPLAGKCSGACFLIYAAADQRATDGERLIGIGASDLSGSAADFLRSNGVPEELIDRVMRQDSGGVYWLSEQDEAHLKWRSPSFTQYLAAHCAWDERLERQASTGARPIADAEPMWACRARVTRADARKVLAAAR